MTAIVKNQGAASGTPIGDMTFFDGSIALDTAQLNGGKASFQASSLHSGRNKISVKYAGSQGFASSRSAILIEIVKSLRSKRKVTP